MTTRELQKHVLSLPPLQKPKKDTMKPFQLELCHYGKDDTGEWEGV